MGLWWFWQAFNGLYLLERILDFIWLLDLNHLLARSNIVSRFLKSVRILNLILRWLILLFKRLLIYISYFKTFLRKNRFSGSGFLFYWLGNDVVEVGLLGFFLDYFHSVIFIRWVFQKVGGWARQQKISDWLLCFLLLLFRLHLLLLRILLFMQEVERWDSTSMFWVGLCHLDFVWQFVAEMNVLVNNHLLQWAVDRWLRVLLYNFIGLVLLLIGLRSRSGLLV